MNPLHVQRKPWNPEPPAPRVPRERPMTRAERLAARRQRKLETLRKVAIAVAVLAVLWACLALSAARDKALWEGYESRVESGEWEVLVQQNADAILGGEADGLPD